MILKEVLLNHKAHRIYPLLKMNWTIVYRISSNFKEEIKLKVKVFKKEINLIRNNNLTL